MRSGEMLLRAARLRRCGRARAARLRAAKTPLALAVLCALAWLLPPAEPYAQAGESAGDPEARSEKSVDLDICYGQ